MVAFLGLRARIPRQNARKFASYKGRTVVWATAINLLDHQLRHLPIFHEYHLNQAVEDQLDEMMRRGRRDLPKSFRAFGLGPRCGRSIRDGDAILDQHAGELGAGELATL